MNEHHLYLWDINLSPEDMFHCTFLINNNTIAVEMSKKIL